jgi:thioredoxin reductase
MSDHERADVLVVGGGPAGLAAALWLGRHNLTTVLADLGEQRNRWVDASFGYLGFDNQEPAAVLDAGRADLDRYPSVSLRATGVRTVHPDRDGAGFVAELDDGCVRCDAVILASGVRDVVPIVPGLQQHFGSSAFVCPLCDGYECRDQQVVVLGAGGDIGAFAEELLQWTPSVVVVPLGDERPTDTLPAGVRLAEQSAVNVHGDARTECVELADGSRIGCDAIFFRADTIPATEFAIHLGCEIDEDGLVVVDSEGRSSVPRVYAAGDCTPGPRIVQVAAAEGARAGLACAQAIRNRTTA